MSHLEAIGGAAFSLLGIVAALAFLARGRAATVAILGAACFIVGNVLFTALFGVAAFAQPAIGEAFLDGTRGVREVNDDVYGTPLFATAGLGFLFLLAGAILLGIAIARRGRPLKWIRIGFATTLVVFVAGFFALEMAQPISGALFALVAVALALRLPEQTSRKSAVEPAGLDVARSRATRWCADVGVWYLTAAVPVGLPSSGQR